jgi:hypothetical protein
MTKAAAILLGLALTLGCAPAHPVGTGSTKLRTYSGVLRVVRPSGIEMARLDLPGGDCLGVSLPENAMARLRRSDGARATVKGRLFEIPNDIEIATLHVKGREVEFRQCNYRFLFVERPEDLKFR